MKFQLTPILQTVRGVGFDNSEPDLMPDPKPVILPVGFSEAKAIAYGKANPEKSFGARHSAHRADKDYLAAVLRVAKACGHERPKLYNDADEVVDIRVKNTPDPIPLDPDTELAVTRAEARIPALYAAAQAKAAEEGKKLRIVNDSVGSSDLRPIVVRESDPQVYVEQQRTLAERTGRPLVESAF